MPGANWMGGKKNAAKTRTKDTAIKQQKVHFGKQRIVGRILTAAPKELPKFDFAHAHAGGGENLMKRFQKPDSSSSPLAKTNPFSTSMAPAPKLKKSSKILMALETYEPISYAAKRLKIVNSANLAGLAGISSRKSPSFEEMSDLPSRHTTPEFEQEYEDEIRLYETGSVDNFSDRHTPSPLQSHHSLSFEPAQSLISSPTISHPHPKAESRSALPTLSYLNYSSPAANPSMDKSNVENHILPSVGSPRSTDGISNPHLSSSPLDYSSDPKSPISNKRSSESPYASNTRARTLSPVSAQIAGSTSTAEYSPQSMTSSHAPRSPDPESSSIPPQFIGFPYEPWLAAARLMKLTMPTPSSWYPPTVSDDLPPRAGVDFRVGTFRLPYTPLSLESTKDEYAHARYDDGDDEPNADYIYDYSYCLEQNAQNAYSPVENRMGDVYSIAPELSENSRSLFESQPYPHELYEPSSLEEDFLSFAPPSCMVARSSFQMQHVENTPQFSSIHTDAFVDIDAEPISYESDQRWDQRGIPALPQFNTTDSVDDAPLDPEPETYLQMVPPGLSFDRLAGPDLDVASLLDGIDADSNPAESAIVSIADRVEGVQKSMVDSLVVSSGKVLGPSLFGDDEDDEFV